MKKYAFLAILINLLGCTSTTPYSSEISYDVKNGYYDSLSLNGWDYTMPLCVALKPKSGYYSEEWGPKLAIAYSTDNSKNIHELELSSTHKDDLSFYSHSRTEDGDSISYIEEDVSWNQEIFLELAVSSDSTLQMLYNNETHEIPLNFVPDSVSFFASSMKAKLSFTVDNCPIPQ